MISQILNILNIIFGALFMICYAYQIVFLFISLFKKTKKYPETENKHKYAFIISARNEENVISQLCDSIKAQDYPEELIEIYVVADNCTDNTALVAKQHGAQVYERHNTELIGKGYALSELFEHIKNTVGFDAFDGYIVVDADNILDKNYVCEMNKCFDTGARLITSYRNSKNYGDNWISAGYSLWFLRESRQLNAVRTELGTTCEIHGTGFLISKEIIKRQGGWIHHLMIEDVQFTVENVLAGEKAVYCHDAILYDEQPTSPITSWWQRIRWCRGYLQILRHYGIKLTRAFFKGRGFSNFDMIMSMCPAFFITVIAVAVNILAIILTLIFDIQAFLPTLIASLILVAQAYLIFAMLGFITIITEWKRIHTSTFKKILSGITFPVFMATYIPIAAASFFAKSGKWKPIKHNPVSENAELEFEDKKSDGETEKYESCVEDKTEKEESTDNCASKK